MSVLTKRGGSSGIGLLLLMIFGIFGVFLPLFSFVSIPLDSVSLTNILTDTS